MRRSRADVVAPAPLRFPEQTQHGAVLTGLAQLPDGQGHVLAATFDHLAPEDIALVLQIGVDDVRTAADAGAVALRSHLDGREVQQAYEDLVAGVAGGMDIDARARARRRERLRTSHRRAVGAGGRHGPPADAQVPDELVTAAMVGRPGRRRAAARGDPPAGRAVLPRPARARRPLVPLRGRRRAGGVPRRSDRAAQLPRAGQAVPGVRLRDRRAQGDRRHRAVSRGRTDPVADVPDAVETGAGPEQRALHGELSAQLRGSARRRCPRSSARSSCCASSSGCRRRRPRRSSGPARVRSGWPSTGRSAGLRKNLRLDLGTAPA